MEKEKREDKFTTKPGEMETIRPQCATCKFNENIKDCEVYIRKPTKYALNIEECPEYSKEEGI